MNRLSAFALLFLFSIFAYSVGEVQRVSYAGHKVISATPQTRSHVELLRKLRTDYNVDLWNEPTGVNNSVMMRLSPELTGSILQKLALTNMPFFTAFHDLQSVIDEERRTMFAPTNQTQRAQTFNFGKYNSLEDIEVLMKKLSSEHPDTVKLEKAGSSYENRDIYNIRISSGGKFGTKPAIMIECGVHAREWTSVAACIYLVNKLITEYGSDGTVTSLVDKYEFNIVPESNPDGFVHSRNVDRMWRKTRSRSSIDWLGTCRGVDANRNFDVEHCGVGTSRNPCTDIFCGDKPFSEGEARALRDLMVRIGSRMKAYFSIHAYSQLWMTPYGTTKKLPSNYAELERIGLEGTKAIAKSYGTQFRVGSIANIIYEAAGSSVDYAYVKQGIKIAYALELRDTGRRGFFLPPEQILPACIETYDGLIGAILAL